jgi:hypothetical protein
MQDKVINNFAEQPNIYNYLKLNIISGHWLEKNCSLKGH